MSANSFNVERAETTWSVRGSINRTQVPCSKTAKEFCSVTMLEQFLAIRSILLVKLFLLRSSVSDALVLSFSDSLLDMAISTGVGESCIADASVGLGFVLASVFCLKCSNTANIPTTDMTKSEIQVSGGNLKPFWFGVNLILGGAD